MLNHLRFVDDLVIIAYKIDYKAKEIIKKLELTSKEVWLNINISKIKLMTDLDTSENINLKL